MDCEKCKIADIIIQLKQDKTDLQEKVKKLNSDYDDLFKDNNYYVETIKAQKRQIDSLNNKLEDSVNYQKILDLETKIATLKNEFDDMETYTATLESENQDQNIISLQEENKSLKEKVNGLEKEVNDLINGGLLVFNANKELKLKIQEQDDIIIKLNDRIQELVTPQMFTEEEKHTLKVLSSPVLSPPGRLIESPVIAKMQSMFDSPIGDGIPFNTMDRVAERMERNQTLNEVIDESREFEDCEDIEPVYSD